MDVKSTAKLLIKHINKPCLYMRELTEITGLSNANIGMHEKRGNIKFAHTPPESRGRGAKILYPFSDLIEVIALSELVSMNQPPVIDGRQSAWMLSNIIFRQLNGLADPDMEYPAAAPDGTKIMHKAADSRYAVLFDVDGGAFDIRTNSKPEPPFGHYEGPAKAWWVMDCKEAALDVVRFFHANRHVLKRVVER